MIEELVLQEVSKSSEVKQESITDTMRFACKKIAPLWPLESFVAVNPYLGLIDTEFNSVALQLANAGGIEMTLPISFYQDKIAEGKISRKILDEVLNKHSNTEYRNADEFIQCIENPENLAKIQVLDTTFADWASSTTDKDWNRFITTRISVWAASFYDSGQAAWSSKEKSKRLFSAWKSEASIDRTPEVTGLKGFRSVINSMPDNAIEATAQAIQILGVPKDNLPFYFHSLLLRVGGWSAFSARIDWDSELYGGNDGELIEFLAVLTC